MTEPRSSCPWMPSAPPTWSPRPRRWQGRQPRCARPRRLPVPAGLCLTTAAFRRAVGPRSTRGLAEGTDAAGLRAAARALCSLRRSPTRSRRACGDCARGAGRGPLVRHRRGPAARQLRRPAGHVPERRRRRRGARRGPAVLGLALDRPGRRLPRRPRHRPRRGRARRGDPAMVDARWAGVLFTADPVTGRRGQAVIDAAPGLGEAVVSGAVDPDHFVVDTGRRDRVPARGARWDRSCGPCPAGAPRAWRTPSGAASLDDADVRTLAALGGRVEALFGAPRTSSGPWTPTAALWLTQSRPSPRSTRCPWPGARACGSTFASTSRRASSGRSPRWAVRGPASRLRRRRSARCAGRRPGAGPADAVRGGRAPVLRHHRRPAQPAWAARGRRRARRDGGALGRGPRAACSTDPRLPSPGAPRCRRAPGGRSLPYRIPPRVVGRRALPARRAATGRRRWSPDGPATLPAPAGRRPGRPVDRARWMLTDASFVAPRIAAGGGRRVPALGLAAQLLRGRARPGELHRAARPAAQRHHRDGPRALGARRPPARRPRDRRRPAPGPRPPSSPGSAARCRRCSQRGSRRLPGRATAAARSPRSTSACRAGPTTRPTCSACSPTTCGSTTPDAAPDGVFAAAPRRPRP